MIWESVITIPTDGDTVQIRYFVTPPVATPEIPVPCYGIGISDGQDTYTVAAFCPEKEEVLRVAQMLCRMEVTPTTFFEVLDDYLALRK